MHCLGKKITVQWSKKPIAVIAPDNNLKIFIMSAVTKGGSKTTALKHGGERTFLQKETMYLLYTPSVIFPYL